MFMFAIFLLSWSIYRRKSLMHAHFGAEPLCSLPSVRAQCIQSPSHWPFQVCNAWWMHGIEWRGRKCDLGQRPRLCSLFWPSVQQLILDKHFSIWCLLWAHLQSTELFGFYHYVNVYSCLGRGRKLLTSSFCPPGRWAHLPLFVDYLFWLIFLSPEENF